jgi:hypothetical protein
VHVLFLMWTVANAHHPALFIGGFLFFLGFARATAIYQAQVDLRTPLLVGFFLAGLVIHGGLQGWWIAPVLASLSDQALFAAATVLTAFNDNALITYLATLVPNLGDPLKAAVVEGAVTGGGLTVIANAPNPAGQALLSRHFAGAVSPLGLFAGALVPTLIAAGAGLRAPSVQVPAAPQNPETLRMSPLAPKTNTLVPRPRSSPSVPRATQSASTTPWQWRTEPSRVMRIPGMNLCTAARCGRRSAMPSIRLY